MIGFYSNRDTCWNCKYFDCEFIRHGGEQIANQWDYHRQYMCNKRGVSFWNSGEIVRDSSCPYFWSGLNEARYKYGCVEPEATGGGSWRATNSFDSLDGFDSFRYTPLYGYGPEELEEEECDSVY